MSPDADIAVLTVIPPEQKAARKALGLTERPQKDRDGTVFYRGTVDSALTCKQYSLVLTCIGRAGNYESAAAATEVITKYRPKALLLMGIAAGIRDKVRVGQVVISDRVIAYELAALVADPDDPGRATEEPRPDIVPTPHAINQDLVNYDPDPERIEKVFREIGGDYPRPMLGQEYEFTKYVTQQVQVSIGSIASGEKLLRHPSKLIAIKRLLHGRTEAGEMEAAGIETACHRFGVPWLVIRGISDFGDDFKDDRFHNFASRIAAATLADFMKFGLDLSYSSAVRPAEEAPTSASQTESKTNLSEVLSIVEFAVRGCEGMEAMHLTAGESRRILDAIKGLRRKVMARLPYLEQSLSPALFERMENLVRRRMGDFISEIDFAFESSKQVRASLLWGWDLIRKDILTDRVVWREFEEIINNDSRLFPLVGFSNRHQYELYVSPRTDSIVSTGGLMEFSLLKRVVESRGIAVPELEAFGFPAEVIHDVINALLRDKLVRTSDYRSFVLTAVGEEVLGKLLARRSA